MERISKYLWGMVLIVIGVIIGLNSLEITNINIFFDGWWTLFIIVPCFIGLFSNEGKTGNIIGLVIGVFLLLGCQDLVSFDLILKLMVPFILVAIGLSMIFKESIGRQISETIKRVDKEGLEEITATFSGQKAIKDDEEFKGANINAIFGAVGLDLRRAKLENETVIKATAIFGGIDIVVPTDVKVKIKQTSIFGGVSDKSIKGSDSDKVIYIEAFSLFGGVEIK